MTRKTVRMVAKACESGPAFTITSGVSYGLLSTLPVIGIGISALAAYKIVAPLGWVVMRLPMVCLVSLWLQLECCQ